MSETKIVSLKDNETGVIFATIVKMRDGRWLEIKSASAFQKNKHIFCSETEWLQLRKYKYKNYSIVYNQRERKISQVEKWDQRPIDEKYKECIYLDKILWKYDIKFQPVLPADETSSNYNPLTWKNTIGYIMKNETLVPFGYDDDNCKIVSEGKGKDTFVELGFSDRPRIWIVKGKQLIQVI
jgi:hypothetical protein